MVNNSAPQQYISKRFSYTQDSIVTINAFVEDDNISDSVFIDFTAPLDNNVTLPMSYAQNYSATQPFGTATPTFINNRTGVITVLNPQQGMYTVALKITSFINGTAIGETHWDFIVHISSTIDPVISWNEINFTGTQATYHNNNATYITAEFDTLEIAVNGQAGLTDSLTLRAFGQKLQGSLNNVSGICTTGNCAQFTGTTLNALQSANGTFYYTTGFGLVPANRDTARVAFVFEVVAKNACGIEVSNAFSVNIIIPKTGSIWSQHVYSTCNFNGVQAHISGDTSNLSWSPTVGVSNATSASPWLNPTISTTVIFIK